MFGVRTRNATGNVMDSQTYVYTRCVISNRLQASTTIFARLTGTHVNYSMYRDCFYEIYNFRVYIIWRIHSGEQSEMFTSS